MRRISRITEAMIVFFNGIFPNYSDFRGGCDVVLFVELIGFSNIEFFDEVNSFCQITRITEDILRMELTLLDVGRISRISEDVQQSWFDFPGGYQRCSFRRTRRTVLNLPNKSDDRTCYTERSIFLGRFPRCSFEVFRRSQKIGRVHNEWYSERDPVFISSSTVRLGAVRSIQTSITRLRLSLE